MKSMIETSRISANQLESDKSSHIFQSIIERTLDGSKTSKLQQHCPQSRKRLEQNTWSSVLHSHTWKTTVLSKSSGQNYGEPEISEEATWSDSGQNEAIVFACDIVVILVWEEMVCPKDCESWNIQNLSTAWPFLSLSPTGNWSSWMIAR